MDRRIERTKKSVVEALGELLNTKEYKDITVNDILKKANIGRSTFYENFDGKEEVFDTIIENLNFHVFEEIHHKDGHAFSTNFDDEIEHLFLHIKEESKHFLLGKSKEKFESQIAECVAIICDEKLQYNTALPRELIHSHIASSFKDTLHYWSDDNFQMPAKKIAGYFLILVREQTY